MGVSDTWQDNMMSSEEAYDGAADYAAADEEAYSEKDEL